MGINARIISGLDPGAIPGGSTKLPPGYRRASTGPISIDRRLKALLSLGLTHRTGFFINANDNFAEEVRLAA